MHRKSCLIPILKGVKYSCRGYKTQLEKMIQYQKVATSEFDANLGAQLC